MIMQDAWVPAVRYVILGLAAALVAVVEGAAGPVGLVVLLFLGWGVLTTLLTWLLAWLVARLLDALPNRMAVGLTAIVLGSGFIWALFFEPYRTPFGRALRGGLLQVLS